MRKLDILSIGLWVLLGGGAAYAGLQIIGVETQQAGLVASAGLAVLLVVWVVSYLTRVLGKQMSFHEQQSMYRTEVLRRRLETMTPEELAALEAEIAAEEAAESANL